MGGFLSKLFAYDGEIFLGLWLRCFFLLDLPYVSAITVGTLCGYDSPHTF